MDAEGDATWNISRAPDACNSGQRFSNRESAGVHSWSRGRKAWVGHRGCVCWCLKFKEHLRLHARRDVQEFGNLGAMKASRGHTARLSTAMTSRVSLSENNALTRVVPELRILAPPKVARTVGHEVQCTAHRGGVRSQCDLVQQGCHDAAGEGTDPETAVHPDDHIK